MKHARKLASLLLALVMVLSLATTAFAADTETAKGEGSFAITLNNTQPNHTYSAYQVFKGDLLVKEDGTKILSNIEWGDGVNGDAILIALKNDVKNFLVQDKNEDGTLKYEDGNPVMVNAFANCTSAANVAKVLEGKEDDGTFMQAFADVVGANLTTTKSGTCEEVKENSKTIGYKISPLTAGYYLVMDTGNVGTSDAYTRYILQVVADVTTNVKTEIPNVEKKIVEGSDRVDANNAGVGKVVSYEITGTVPNYTGYDKYFYIINDTLSAGLTFNDDVTVTVGGTVLSAGVDYYLYTGTAAAPYTFQVAFRNIKDYETGAAIVVNYSATVNANAVIGETGNPNHVNLTYSNNPNSDENGENLNKPGTPDDKVPTGESPDDITITYVAEIDILKTKEDGTTPLAGAEFTLTGTSKQTVLTGKTYYEIAENGTYYLLKNGTYTTEAPQAEEKDENGNVTQKSNEDLYVSTTVKYVEKTATTTTEVITNVKMVAVSDVNGKITFKGLGEGTYTIEETVVPGGYNKAPNMTVVIVCTEPTEVVTGQEKADWSLGTGTSDGVTLHNATEETTSVTNGIYDVKIINKPGTELPSTGGIGTTIFYVVGTVLVLAAVVLLVTKKRMSAKG